jgi:outer membrane protein assembly factor BamD
LGDSYAAEARIVRAQPNLPEDAKGRLVKIYTERAIASYRKVALEHSASPHVEDARDRLAAMNVSIPTPTAEQVATSAALENSRGQYHLQDRAKLIILRRPDTVLAAHSGEPPLTDATPTLAPAVVRQVQSDYAHAMNPASQAATAAPATDASVENASPAGEAAPAPNAPAKASSPLQLNDIPAAGAGDGGSSATMTNVPSNSQPAAASGGSNSMGVEVLTPGANGNGQAPAQNDPNGGLKAVGPTSNATAPPIEKPATAPDAINDVVPGEQPAGQPTQTTANGKKKTPKPTYDKDEESSSTHKKKKGLKKINPF